MTVTILHLLGSAGVEGTGVARIVAALAQDPSRHYRHHVCFLHGTGPLADYLQQQGVASTCAIDLRNPGSSAWRLWRLLRKLKPAIVHQHAGGPRLTRLLHWLSEARLIVHVHSTIDEQTLHSGAPQLSPRADLVIANSQAAASHINDARCRVIHAGVHVPAGLGSVASTSQALVVGAAGRLASVKGYEFLVRAFAKVAAAFPQARLLICGDGPLRSDLQQQIRRLDCSHCIDLALWCEDYPQRAQAWDIFVQPSIDEGLPISLLEAMAAGLPVIGSNTGGMPEVIVDGVTGLLVMPADVDALAAALRTLLRDADLRARLGKAARQHIVQHFSSDKMRSEIHQLYASLTSPSP